MMAVKGEKELSKIIVNMGTKWDVAGTLTYLPTSLFSMIFVMTLIWDTVCPHLHASFPITFPCLQDGLIDNFCSMSHCMI
jgi:hypothetical protein